MYIKILLYPVCSLLKRFRTVIPFGAKNVAGKCKVNWRVAFRLGWNSYRRGIICSEKVLSGFGRKEAREASVGRASRIRTEPRLVEVRSN